MAFLERNWEIWELVECSFLVGLGGSPFIELARSLKWLHLAGKNNEFQLHSLAVCCFFFKRQAEKHQGPDLNIQNSPNYYLCANHIYKQNSMKVN